VEPLEQWTIENREQTKALRSVAEGPELVERALFSIARAGLPLLIDQGPSENA
jgi:hypothetical protein